MKKNIFRFLIFTFCFGFLNFYNIDLIQIVKYEKEERDLIQIVQFEKENRDLIQIV